MLKLVSSVGYIPFQPFSKRCLDVGLASILLFLLSPVFVLTALILQIHGGAVIYGHRRVGLHGREFTVWKFRTMVCEADQKLQVLLRNCSQHRSAWSCNRKLPDDPRVTRVGRVLRQTSIDELPQLWNVLRGEMSLVGPRPVPRDELYEKYGLSASAYESVKPGLTGLWQVSGRNNLTYTERVALDKRYAISKNGWMDVSILFRTIWTVIRCNGW